MASSLSKQVDDAQAEMATWTPEQRARVQLEGRSDRNNVAAQAGDEPMCAAEAVIELCQEWCVAMYQHAANIGAGGPGIEAALDAKAESTKAAIRSLAVSPRATADVERVTITPALRRAVDMTRADLGESGSNYPFVRELLAFAESHIATTKPGA